MEEEREVQLTLEMEEEEGDVQLTLETLDEDCVYLLLTYLTSARLRALEKAAPFIKRIRGYDALKKRKFIIGHPWMSRNISLETITIEEIDRHFDRYEENAASNFMNW